MVARVLREPLVHFLLLGAGIFAAYTLLAGPENRTPGAIVVTQARIENLSATFSRVRSRPPTADELNGLIRDYVREEAAVREAAALGLDRDDTVIRRRLRQKLEFIADDLAATTEPTDEELKAFLAAHPDLFTAEPRVTFRQIYLKPERGARLSQDAARLLAQLRQSNAVGDVSSLGDPIMLEERYEATTLRDVAKLFGESFAARLDATPAGRWEGPIESGYGLHLVLISERRAGRLPEFEAVRDVVRREWMDARHKEASERFYDKLVQRYTVTVEGVQGAGIERGGEHTVARSQKLKAGDAVK